MASDATLGGRRLLLTRAQHQVAPLQQALQQLGAEVLHYPVFAIEAVPLEPKAWNARQQAEFAIFPSVNAVQQLFAQYPATEWPQTMSVFAVGPSTAACLAEYIHQPIQLPEVYSSDGLLALDALQQVAGRQGLLVQGEAGHPGLYQTLSARGANLAHWIVYRRVAAQGAHLAEVGVPEWDVVLLGSLQTLQYWWQGLSESQQQEACLRPWLVISANMARHAQRLGCQQVWQAQNAQDSAIIACLVQHFQ